MKPSPHLALCVVALALPLAAAEEGRFESLGVPVRVGGLMGCIIGPDGRGGEALYFNFNQTGGKLFLVQVNPAVSESVTSKEGINTLQGGGGGNGGGSP